MEEQQYCNIFSSKRIKRGDHLVYENGGEEDRYQEFIKGLTEGQIVLEFLEATADDGTNLQLAKIHVCIRALAAELGYTFKEMKTEVKRRAGLIHGEHEKSLGDCSKDDLGLVIEELKVLGLMVNMNFD